MAKAFYYLVFFIIIFINIIIENTLANDIRHGFPPDLLHINNDDRQQLNKPQLIDFNDDDHNNNNNLLRSKRAAAASSLSSSSSSGGGSGGGGGDSSGKDGATTITATTIAPSSSNLSKLNNMINNNNNSSDGGKSIMHDKDSDDINDFMFETNNKNISHRINHLNDSHAQLMVHWLGDNTNVMICLAREPPLLPLEDPKISPPPLPSSVYISYDYGNKFEDKTLLFQIDVNGTKINSTLDQFMTHPTYNTIVFTDPRNKVIFTNSDYGKTIKSHMLQFTPSEVSFYEKDPNTFLVLDKEDPERKLYYTLNFGDTFQVLQMHVKSFVWSSGEDLATHLYVERLQPSNLSSVIFLDAIKLFKENPANGFNLLIEDVQDFQIKKDFMFAVRKVLNDIQLFISYKRNRFLKADFQTELEIKALHIADVEGKRIMVSAVHSEVLSHLYVSETNAIMNAIKFVPSLDNVFTYIPDVTWKNSWLAQSADQAFTDIYRVEGLRGIYIASTVRRTSIVAKLVSSISVEYLSSVITFDHGSTWQLIKAPTVDDEGQEIKCKNCSLHLSQKFSQLYPITRSVSIMSSKSAPGVIMATGIIGTNLKGHPGVFISRDAGQTWKQILKSYHFFNFGDHGGVLVAVRYFKSKGETREILYSTDEGEVWSPFAFHTVNLKVYGLMTEPNTNTTIFTLFGSEPSSHRWLIVKIDLKNAFEYNCTADDYKFWAPGSLTGDSVMPCVLGLKETYQRRAAHSKCYNGKDYNRPIRTEVCQCSQWDFECDYGFRRTNINSPCIQANKSTGLFDPYEIPPVCKPGEYYYRTKGYKLISGDVCVEGYASQYLPQMTACPVKQTNDFLIVAQRDKISRIDISSGAKTVLPLNNLKNVIAIDFDMKHNCVFYADILTDEIGRQCLNGNQSVEYLLKTDLASVEGMSYDWISELLFFVDGTRLKIEAIKTSQFPNEKALMRSTIIGDKQLLKPRGIVVHPLEGYLFWTDWSQLRPSISRANLDGTDIRVLFTKPQVVWPNGITIDYGAERVYWVDASKDYIGSCNLHGKMFITVLKEDNRVAHPFAVGVYKDLIFWDDWKMNSVFSADKDHGIMISTIADDMHSLMDLKVYSHTVQSGKNACSNQNKCTHICVGMPGNKHTCLCPDGMVKSSNGDCLCPGTMSISKNNTCSQVRNTCASEFFTCANKLCVPLIYRCDTENDCNDNSDEENCPPSKAPCPPHMFACKSDSKCIPEYFKCDHDADCVDGSDESFCNFTACKANEFTCGNGRCINQKWKCDDEDDCRDGSDEKNCEKSNGNNNGTAIKCKDNEFECRSKDGLDNVCISEDWRCDGDPDCLDGIDEQDCANKECEAFMFSCGNGACIYKSWQCDGDNDCHNGADEKNCTTKFKVPFTSSPDVKCHDWMFKCENDKCVAHWWKCDGINDCGDGSDEFGCPATESVAGKFSTTTTTRSPVDTLDVCTINQFMCTSGRCISRTFVCDGYRDCIDGEDELDCPNKKACGADKFRCRSDGRCLPFEKYCDGIKHCADGSDELKCSTNRMPIDSLNPKESCKEGTFLCAYDSVCMPMATMCDGHTDCYDGSDEDNCTQFERLYQVNNLYSYHEQLNATSFTIYWTIINNNTAAANKTTSYEYLPSMAVANTTNWKNHSVWIDVHQFTFDKLIPYTTYNVTVYVRVKNSKVIATPYMYINVTTAEGTPTEPLNVNVTQLNASRVQVSWESPTKIYGILKEYTVFYRIQSMQILPIQSVKVSPKELSIILEANFLSNTTYEFWVRARNYNYESRNSKLVQLSFKDMTSVDRLTGLRTGHIDTDYIELKWNAIKNVDGYIVTPVLPSPFPKCEPIRTNDTEIKLDQLPKGVYIMIKVSAYINQYYGRPASISLALPGEILPMLWPKLTMEAKNDVLVSWTVPEIITKIVSANNTIKYGIYYGTTMDEYIEKPRLITENTSILINTLIPCESYYIGVNVLQPYGPGPLNRNPIIWNTDYNPDAPPHNLNVEFTDDNAMNVTWQHNCLLKLQKYPFYKIELMDLITHSKTMVQLNPMNERHLTHTFQNIPKGAVFNVSVSTANSKYSEATSIIARAPPLPSPHQLKVYQEINGTYVIYWTSVNFTDEPHTYQLLVYSGVDVTGEVIFNKTSAIPPMFVDGINLASSSDGGGGGDPERIFTFGVRLLTEKGYYSNISEVEHFYEVQLPTLSFLIPNSSATSFWLYTIPILVLIAIALPIIYLIQRRRRLANSFSRFANSHYDTKTGATRIGDALDEDEHHEHQPRFEDDEPLVIA